MYNKNKIRPDGIEFDFFLIAQRYFKEGNLLFPDVFKVENADLVELAATVRAGDEWFQLQHVVLRRLELLLLDQPAQQLGIKKWNKIYLQQCCGSGSAPFL